MRLEYRVMMYANPLLIVYELYRERNAYLCIVSRFRPNLYYIIISKQCKCTVYSTQVGNYYPPDRNPTFILTYLSIIFRFYRHILGLNQGGTSNCWMSCKKCAVIYINIYIRLLTN